MSQLRAKINARKVTTGEIRINFPILFKPRQEEDGTEKYSVMVLIPKEDAAGTMEAIRAAEKQAIEDGMAGVWGGKRPQTIDSIVRDGDEDYDLDDRPEVEGHWVLNVRTKFAPQVVDARLAAVTDPEAVYSGCYGRVSMTAFPYKTRGKTGVSFALGNVQFLRDGERLGGRANARDEFTAVETAEDFI